MQDSCRGRPARKRVQAAHRHKDKRPVRAEMGRNALPQKGRLQYLFRHHAEAQQGQLRRQDLPERADGKRRDKVQAGRTQASYGRPRPVQPRRADPGRNSRGVRGIRKERGPEFFLGSPFDKAKYEALLKGLEVSEVRLSEINLGDRIDADYFTKANLQIDKRLKALHTSELRSFADFVASAFYPAATQLYSIGDTPFIRCVDCIDFPLITKIQDESFEKIPMSFVSENDGINLLNQNDIVITKVGSPCYASIIYEHDVVALSRTVMGLKNVRDINPFYLLIFLRSKYGFLQLLRARELTIQYQLTLERVKRILVFIPDTNFQHSIEIIVKDSIDKLKQSQSLYSEAEEILLTELGLKNWQPGSKAVNIKTLKESFLRTGRLDAEYYQPKYDETEAFIT